MGIQLQIEERNGYLAAKYTGAGTVEEGLRLFEFIAENCRRKNYSRLLIDCTGGRAEGAHFIDRYAIGERLQIFARYGVKVASLLTDEQIDPRRFGEQVARNRGVDVRAFTDLQEAEEWLLQ
jgi:hypothetical protein